MHQIVTILAIAISTHLIIRKLKPMKEILDAIQADVAAIAAQVETLLSKIEDPALVAEAQAIKDGLDAVVAKGTG
jgi:hypothetical protein